MAVETLVRGGGRSVDGKVSCETLIAGDPPAADPDLPPESFLVKIGDEIGMGDINIVYDRDDSTKGNTNPKSQQQQQQQQQSSSHHPKPRSNSQRFSGNLKHKAPIIGLPNKLQHSGYLSHSVRHSTKGRIFPKGGAGAGRKPAVPAIDPGSPKVSCFGKVLSDRERDHCKIRRRDSPPPPAATAEVEAPAGCWASLAAFFRCRGDTAAAEFEADDEWWSSSPESGGEAAARKIPPPSAAEMEAAPPALGGMMRFTSRRRAASWGGDVDVEAGGHVAWSEPLDLGRRSVGSLEDDSSGNRRW